MRGFVRVVPCPVQTKSSEVRHARWSVLDFRCFAALACLRCADSSSTDTRGLGLDYSPAPAVALALLSMTSDFRTSRSWHIPRPSHCDVAIFLCHHFDCRILYPCPCVSSLPDPSCPVSERHRVSNSLFLRGGGTTNRVRGGGEG